MDKDQESLQFWSTLLQSLADSDPKNDLCPDICSPILVMSTSMATDASSDPSNAPGDGDKTGLEKAIAKTKDKNINEVGQRSTGKRIEEKNEDAKEEIKNLGKRARTNEARNIAEKRRRTDIKTKIENLKQLTPNCKKRDIASTLDCIIDHIRSMKHYVEMLHETHKTQRTILVMTKLLNGTMQRQSMGPMLPLGMKMDFPAPWYPFIHPNFIRPPFNGFTPGETSGGNQQTLPVTTNVHNQQIVPVTTTKGFNNQPHSSNLS